MKIIEAKRAGIAAYEAGKKSAPCLNQEFIKAACESETKTADLLSAYSTGWHIANLANNAIPGAPSVTAYAAIFAA